jgi:hypothetical protein
LTPYNFGFKHTNQGPLNGNTLLSIEKGKPRLVDLLNGPVAD